MMIQVPPDRTVYIFELDDVLFPRRDYLLQVYYLFSHFVEYTEGRSFAKSMVDFMKDRYEREGECRLLEETINHFHLSESYKENFERLKANAHLPLKLMLSDTFKQLAKKILQGGKKIALLTDGNPVEQLNKLKHIDWEELEEVKKELRVYFIKELEFRNLKPIPYLAKEYHVDESEICFVERL